MSKPVLITVNGTGVPDPFGPGFSSDLGRAFQWDPWQALANNVAGVNYAGPPIEWQPIGYPAAVTPMQPSIEAGRAEVNNQIARRPRGTPLFLSGYSQGAGVITEVWVHDILDSAGQHHDRLDDVRGIIQFGDIFRCPGIAHGNEVAGLPQPKTLDGVTTGGIGGPADMTPDQTPDFYLSCALDGDMYACCPVGDNPWTGEAKPGQVETSIEKIIMHPSFMNIVKIAKAFLMPVGTVEAMYNAILFFGAGTNAPHWRYQPFIPPLVDWLASHA